MDTSSRGRSLQGLPDTARGGGGYSPPRPLPSPHWRLRGGEGSKLAPGAPRDRTCARAASETGTRRCGSPAGWEGAPVRRGRGLDPPGARVVGGGGGPPPERVRAGGGGQWGGAEEGEHECKRETLHWGGRGLRLRCGGEAGRGGGGR